MINGTKYGMQYNSITSLGAVVYEIAYGGVDRLLHILITKTRYIPRCSRMPASCFATARLKANNGLTSR